MALVVLPPCTCPCAFVDAARSRCGKPRRLYCWRCQRHGAGVSDHLELLLELTLDLRTQRGHADREEEREEADRRDPEQREEPEHEARKLEEPDLQHVWEVTRWTHGGRSDAR